MKEVYGSTWTLQLMVGFILLFVAFLTLTITYSKVFRVKNDVLSIIEKYNGINEDSIEIVNNFLSNSGYNITGVCQSGENIKGVSNLEDTSLSALSDITNGERYFYCIKKERKNSKRNSLTTVNYEVTLFYKFNIPILGNIATFTVKGKTTDMIDIQGF